MGNCRELYLPVAGVTIGAVARPGIAHFLQIPWHIYCYRGDISALAEHYQGMKRYLKFMTSMAEGNLLSFGLGDWCPPNNADGYGYASPETLTSTGYYYANSKMLARCAQLFGYFAEAEEFAALAEKH